MADLARVYLINLDRSPDRLHFMQKQAQSVGFEFTRIAAVDGKLLPRALDRRLNPGEVGCFLSHRRAWQMIHQSGDAWGVVLEDDARISPDFPHVIASLPSHAPADADIIKIDASPKTVRIDRRATIIAGRRLHKRRGSLYGTPGYAISRKACGWLLDRPDDVPMAIDVYLFHRTSPIIDRLNTYVMVPGLIVQQSYIVGDNDPGFGSLIHPGDSTHRGPSRPVSRARMIRHLIKRSLIQAIQPTTTHCIVGWR